MIGDNAIPAYNVPSGILFDMHREAAAKRPGVLDARSAWTPSSIPRAKAAR